MTSERDSCGASRTSPDRLEAMLCLLSEALLRESDECIEKMRGADISEHVVYHAAYAHTLRQEASEVLGYKTEAGLRSVLEELRKEQDREMKAASIMRSDLERKWHDGIAAAIGRVQRGIDKVVRCNDAAAYHHTITTDFPARAARAAREDLAHAVYDMAIEFVIGADHPEGRVLVVEEAYRVPRGFVYALRCSKETQMRVMTAIVEAVKRGDAEATQHGADRGGPR